MTTNTKHINGINKYKWLKLTLITDKKLQVVLYKRHTFKMVIQKG